MLKTYSGDNDEPDYTVMNFNERSCEILDGAVMLTTPKVRGLRRLFTKQRQTKVILGVKRVPFMALYQVTFSLP